MRKQQISFDECLINGVGTMCLKWLASVLQHRKSIVREIEMNFSNILKVCFSRFELLVFHVWWRYNLNERVHFSITKKSVNSETDNCDLCDDTYGGTFVHFFLCWRMNFLVKFSKCRRGRVIFMIYWIANQFLINLELFR